MNLALFDFDGTITTREMLPDFFRLAIPRRRLLAGQVLLAPLIVGYRLGWVPGTVVRAAIVRFGFTGLPVADYEAFAAAFAMQVLPGVLRPEVMQRIAAPMVGGMLSAPLLSMFVIPAAYRLMRRRRAAELAAPPDVV